MPRLSSGAAEVLAIRALCRRPNALRHHLPAELEGPHALGRVNWRCCCERQTADYPRARRAGMESVRPGRYLGVLGRVADLLPTQRTGPRGARGLSGGAADIVDDARLGELVCPSAAIDLAETITVKWSGPRASTDSPRGFLVSMRVAGPGSLRLGARFGCSLTSLASAPPSRRRVPPTGGVPGVGAVTGSASRARPRLGAGIEESRKPFAPGRGRVPRSTRPSRTPIEEKPVRAATTPRTPIRPVVELPHVLITQPWDRRAC